MSDLVKIGKYQILDQVGEGAMGVVYKAIDPVLNRPVAVKVMSEGMAQDAALRERFLREAQAAGSLQHPNVVTIYDFGETDGHLFIAMEFIEGTDLEELLKNRKALPLVAKLDFMIDVLNGLSYAHRRGIVHRDIKPANIRIDSEGHARIMDFGVAHLASSNLTGTGIMMGTPNYMAPENITGGEVSAASDLFSVGAVLYELLTNNKPFEADTLHRVLFRIVSDPPPDLLEVQPDLPPPLAKIIKKSLAKDLDVRYATANEMANDLSAVRATLGAPRASRTVSQRSSIEKSLQAQRNSTMRKMRVWQTVGAGAAVLVLSTAIGVSYVRGKSSVASSPPIAGTTVAGTPADAAPVPGPDTVPTAPQVTETQSALQDEATRARTPAAPALPPPERVSRMDQPAAGGAALQGRAESPSSTPIPASPTGTKTTDPARDSTTRTSTVQNTLQQKAAVDSPVTAAAPPAAAITQPPTAPRDSAPATAAEPVVENPRTAIASIMTAYERAIATMNVAEVKRVYTGMTPAQQSAWETFFSSVRSMTADFEISSIDVTGTTAVARLTGAYEFVNRLGRTERQPAAFEASFRRDGDRWRLEAIH